MKSRFFTVLLACFLSAPALAQSPCSSVQFGGADYTICVAKPAKDDIRLFWKGKDGEPYGGFSLLEQDLAGERTAGGKTLVFAMNAGMYHANGDPVGLYVEGGQELRRINLRGGPGNFHMKPNGVFYVSGKTAGVMEAERFAKSDIKTLHATQSGPMLVIEGRIHPKILPSGTSAKVRNGVGVDKNGAVYFAISDEPVTFYAFASLFRDYLRCSNALFLDGSISALYAPGLGRTADPFLPIGPIVGVVSRRK